MGAVAAPDWMTLVVAVIAATAMLGVARMTWIREREARRADHESERLAEFLDAALDLRDVIVESTFAAYDPVVTTYDRRHAAFVARREAVRSPRVRDLSCTWERVAHDALLTDHRVEQAAWHALMVALGRARRRRV